MNATLCMHATIEWRTKEGCAMNKPLPIFVCNYEPGMCRWYDDTITCGETCHAYGFTALHYDAALGEWSVKDEAGGAPIWARASGPEPPLTVESLRQYLAFNYYTPASLNRAALLKLKRSYAAAVKYLAGLVTGCSGQSGPAMPSIMTMRSQVQAHLPRRHLTAPPDLVLSGAAVAKLALAAHDIHDAPGGQLSLL